MKLNPHPRTLQRQLLAVSITAALSFTAAGSLYAATPQPAKAAAQSGVI